MKTDKSNLSVKWLHLSDFHFGKDEFGNSQMSSLLLKFLQEKSDQGWKPDLVFFTGDISNKGRPGEYAIFNNKLLIPLVEMYGYEIIARCVFVPGNHDVDREIHGLTDTYSILGRKKIAFDCTAEGAALRADLAERFSAFRDALPAKDDMDGLFGEDGYFAKCFTINEIDIGILGVNTAWLCQSELDKGQLTPGRHSVRLGLEKIAQYPVRFVLGHHPLSWMADGERQAVESQFAQQRVIYLHGHLHETFSG